MSNFLKRSSYHLLVPFFPLRLPSGVNASREEKKGNISVAGTLTHPGSRPGVIGSVSTTRLQAAGSNVTLLARGQHTADLRSSGLVLQDGSTEQSSTSLLRFIERLVPKAGATLSLGFWFHLQLLPVTTSAREYRAILQRRFQV